ncbi:MAG: hypothetical protein OEY73_05515 [Hadesarchaea archaeon]|nr:hypothetical protein [Hadesarchaea archaeon]
MVRLNVLRAFINVSIAVETTPFTEILENGAEPRNPWRGGETLVRDKPSKLKLRLALGPPSRKLSRLLRRLKRTTGAPSSRQVGKQATNELVAAQIKLKQADLKALDQLRRIAIMRCRTSPSQRKKGNSAKCPSCGRNGARLLVALNPGVVLKCPGCGEVWEDG